MFIDQIYIYVKAGDGGDGHVSFRREKFVPRGGPDGGDGGNGGDVKLLVDPSTHDLRNFYYDPKLIADDGKDGGRYRATGKSGKRIIGKVPPGTVVHKVAAETVQEVLNANKSGDKVEQTQVADLKENGQEFVLCSGGVGGKGNTQFKSATNQAPREFTEGTPGEEGVYLLELRRIADVGLVGFPNAGKSTLIGKMSRAQPKVANYPFTTLQPVVGVVEFSKYRRCTMADIPGIIEDAHKNRGLGLAFLRHITRCRLLLHVLDMSGFEGRDPISDLEILRRELKEYSPELAQYPWAIVANKMDMEGSAKNLKILQDRFPKIRQFPISAKLGEGLEELRSFLENEAGTDAHS